MACACVQMLQIYDGVVAVMHYGKCVRVCMCVCV